MARRSCRRSATGRASAGIGKVGARVVSGVAIDALTRKLVPRFSFPGSAWERSGREALPRDWATSGRQSLQGSAFPGGAWERVNLKEAHPAFAETKILRCSAAVDFGQPLLPQGRCSFAPCTHRARAKETRFPCTVCARCFVNDPGPRFEVGAGGRLLHFESCLSDHGSFP